MTTSSAMNAVRYHAIFVARFFEGANHREAMNGTMSDDISATSMPFT
jgi:hypothetical protein